MFHDGNEDLIICQEECELFRKELKFHIIMAEYPNYSIYFGKYDYDYNLILMNSLIIYDYIKTKFNVLDDDIFIYGKGLGSGPSLYLASKRKVGGLFIINGFTSIRDVTQSFFVSFFFEDIFKNIDYIDKVLAPTLFIHDKKNSLIYYQHSLKLYEKCSSKIVYNRQNDS